jgi:hypothetical protein
MAAMASDDRIDCRVVASLASLLLLVGAWPARAQDPAPGRVDWDLIETIVSRIESPHIPARVYRVADFGAAGDGAADARPAILAAIARASADGGGRVVLSPGVWRSDGPIHLQSRIELHLERGAHLLFSPDPQHYLPVVETRWEGTRVLSYSPLIYARDVEDVAITGPGTIDGNAQSAFHGWHRLAEPDMLRLRRMGFSGVPLEERVFGPGTHLRPPLVQLVRARRVKLEGYTAVNSPFWVNHLVYCEHATVRGLNVESRFPNNDGVDVDSSRWVLVEGSTFRTGEIRGVSRPRPTVAPSLGSEYVVVRYNDMGGEDGIALGSDVGDIRYVFTDNLLRLAPRPSASANLDAAARSSTGVRRSVGFLNVCSGSSRLPRRAGATSPLLPRHRVRGLRGRGRGHAVRGPRARGSTPPGRAAA